ncbi:MAG: NAD(P)/FAD-dependent oxidoreductase [Verrucomicrobiota bacterium]
MADQGKHFRKDRKRILVLGAGFGGLAFAQNFKHPKADLLVIDRQNHHLFQPLLYQVATAGLAATDIAQPIRSILSKRRDITTLMGEVSGFDLDHHIVRLIDGKEIEFDYCVLALGAQTSYFGNDHWARWAPGLKTNDDAKAIRRMVLKNVERAEALPDDPRVPALLRLVIIGGGPTGVELAGAFSELFRQMFDKDFRHLHADQPEIHLYDASDRLLAAYDEDLSASAESQLAELGVEIHKNMLAKDIEQGKVTFQDGTVVETENIIWTAGVAPGDWTQQLGVPTDKTGRIKVEPDLSLPGYPSIFALGDLIHLVDAKGQPLPGVAQTAIQTGKHIAKLIEDEAEQGRPTPPNLREKFVYNDLGMMATIGRSRAIAQKGDLKLKRYPAWLAWLFIHLIFLVGFRNRVSVLTEWFYNYVAFRSGARLITGQDKTFIGPINRLTSMRADIEFAREQHEADGASGSYPESQTDAAAKPVPAPDPEKQGD